MMQRDFARLVLAVFIPLLFCHCAEERLIRESGNLVPKTADQDPGISAIAVNGARLHAEDYGSADSALIVVLHGGPGADYRYLLNCKELADHGYHVAFYDQRGSGLSERFPSNVYSVQLMLDELTGVIAHYRTSPAQKVFLLGHSWGAMLAAAYIDAYPNAIDGVVLAEPGGLVWDDVMGYVERSRSIVVTKELFNDMLYADQFITGKDGEHAILDYKYALMSVGDGSADNPIGNEGGLPFWRSGAVINMALFAVGDDTKPNWTARLGQYPTDVLFIYSEHNKAYGLAHAQKVSSPFAKVELFEAQGAGHDMLSYPAGWQQCLPKILAYFNRLKHA